MTGLLTPLEGRFYRCLSPRYQSMPLSGAGAARHGGRFNRPGVPALYLSMELETAVQEYQQTLKTRPGTFCVYQISASAIADLRNPAPFGISSADLECPWRDLKADGLPVPSWVATDRLLALGTQGALVPSNIAKTGTNLVLWDWNTPTGASATFDDPLAELDIK